MASDTKTELQIGASCQVTCPVGSEPSKDELRCEKTYKDEFNFAVNLSQVPQCLAITCEEQTINIENGSGESDGNGYDSKCNFTCDEGYKLFGAEQITCGANGWSADQPFCQAAVCDNKPNPINGQVMCATRGSRKRLRCTYTCNTGYELYPTDFQPEILCKSNGEWDNEEVPECRPKTCSELPSFPKTKFQCSDDNRYGSQCWVTCKSGYEVNTSETHDTMTLLRCGMAPALERDPTSPQWLDEFSQPLDNLPHCVPRKCASV